MKAILLAYAQGCGKSQTVVRNSITRLAKEGKSVLLAVPRSDLALEYGEAFEQAGISYFILASHKAIFNPEKPNQRLSDMECPYYDNIQELIKVGASSEFYKDEYCSNCPFANECYYPNQYKQVMEPQYNVVIIQHAHFSCSEVMNEILKKRFDALFIDESFIESIFQQIEVPEKHIELIGTLADGYDWAAQLHDWLNQHNDPYSILKPHPDELAEAKELFEKEGQKYLVPDYIRFHNSKRQVNANSRIEVVYELPYVKLLVMTDATPPLELIKHLTGIKEIEVYGDNQVIDVKHVRNENEIIQLLDFSSSVTKLSVDEKLHEVLDKIAEIVGTLDADQKCVITAYSKDHERIRNYLADRYPYLTYKIVLTVISKGINTFANFDVQFILASRFLLGRDYLLDAYKYRQVANFYRRKNGEPILNNPFPKDLSAEAKVSTKWQPVRRIHKDQSGSAANVYEYPDFQVKVPKITNDIHDDQYWYRLIYEYAVGNIQQAIRVRLTKDKPRTIYVLTNLSLPSTLITQSLDYNTWLNT